MDVLRTAAALGKSFPFRRAGRGTARRAEDALLDALDEASAAQLIRANRAATDASAGGDDRFAFTHDKIREVLNEERTRFAAAACISASAKRWRSSMASVATAMRRGRSDARAGPRPSFHAGRRSRALARRTRAARRATPSASSRTTRRSSSWTQARESAEALQRADDAARDRRADRRHPRRCAEPRIRRSRATSARSPRERCVAARAALKAKIGNAYCAVGDPRGVPYLDAGARRARSRNPDQRTRARDGADGPLLPLPDRASARRSNILDRARELGRAAGRPVALSLIQSYLAGAPPAPARVRGERPLGAGQHRARRADAVSRSRRRRATSSWRRTPAARGYWDEALAYAAKDREEGASASGALARVAWSQFCLAQGLHGKGELAQAARRPRESALAMCEQIGEMRLATWASTDGSRSRRRPGRRRGRARDSRARIGSARSDWTRWCCRRGRCTALGYAAIAARRRRGGVALVRQYVALVARHRERRRQAHRHARLRRQRSCSAGRFDEALAAGRRRRSRSPTSRSRAASPCDCPARASACFLARGDTAAATRALDEAIARSALGGEPPRVGENAVRAGGCAGIRDDARGLRRSSKSARARPSRRAERTRSRTGLEQRKSIVTMPTSDDHVKPASIAAQALGWIDEQTRAIAPPIHTSTTFIRDPDNQYRSGRIYARDHNPTFDQAEAVLTALEGGHASLLFASGHGRGHRGVPGARAGRPRARPQGDVLVAAQLAARLRTQWGLRVDVIDMAESRRRAARAAARRAPSSCGSRRPPIRCGRSPTSPRLATSRTRRAPLVAVDSTVATPVLTPAADARRRHRHALRDEVSQRPLRRDRRHADDARGHARSGSASGRFARNRAGSSARSRRGC